MKNIYLCILMLSWISIFNGISNASKPKTPENDADKELQTIISRAQTSPQLTMETRPLDLQQSVDRTFASLAQQTSGDWLYNGSDGTSFHNIDLIKVLAHAASDKNKSDIFFLDIGAGDFQSLNTLAKGLNSLDNLDEKTFHLIGTRGERYTGAEQEKLGNCILHKFGAFKVENLKESLEGRGLHVEGKLDVVVSKWCFRHLCDPVGTFITTINHLTPGTGLMFFDGFFFGFQGQEEIFRGNYANTNMKQLIAEIKWPFLMMPCNVGRSLDRFVLRRETVIACNLSWRYINFIEVNAKSLQCDSGVVCNFDKRSPKFEQFGKIDRRRGVSYNGDKSLFDFFADNNYFLDSHKSPEELERTGDVPIRDLYNPFQLNLPDPKDGADNRSRES